MASPLLLIIGGRLHGRGAQVRGGTGKTYELSPLRPICTRRQASRWESVLRHHAANPAFEWEARRLWVRLQGMPSGLKEQSLSMCAFFGATG